MDRRDFIQYATLATILGGTVVLSSCAGMGGKAPSNPEATEEDVMRHFTYNPVKDTLDSIDRVTYFSNKEEFEKEFYQEQLPPEERMNVMAGLYWHNENEGIFSQREAALTWFIAKEFTDLKIMCNIIGYKWNERGNDRATNTYDVGITPALFFGKKENENIDRHKQLFGNPTLEYVKNGLNLYGGPENLQQLKMAVDYYRQAIPQHLGIERQPWKKS